MNTGLSATFSSPCAGFNPTVNCLYLKILSSKCIVMPQQVQSDREKLLQSENFTLS